MMNNNNQNANRKRKINSMIDDLNVGLTLETPSIFISTNSSQSYPSSQNYLNLSNSEISYPQPQPPAPTRARRNPTRGVAKSETITPPFPWATDRRAKVYSVKFLTEREIHVISGEVQCKKCEKSFTLEFNVEEKFKEVACFLLNNQSTMHERAPPQWISPSLVNCRFCGQINSCKPLIAPKKKSINWLFLLLGQFLGCCTLKQLKYFCKHNDCHRTGAKDRVLYLAYLALLKQLHPEGPFDYHHT